MGRLITYDSFVDETIKTFCRERYFHSGLIIGQCTDQKDIVIRLCATPSFDEDLQHGGGDVPNINQTLDRFDVDDWAHTEEWIGQHAKQLMRALPGGLDVLGFYVVADSEFTRRYEQKLKEVLLAIFNILKKIRSFKLYSMERILLTICPIKSVTVCKTCNITDSRNSPNPVPAVWKLLPAPMRWQRVRCKLAVDVKFPIKSEDAGLSLQKQIEIGLHPFLESIEEAHAVVNGVKRDLDELLDPSDSKNYNKKGQNEENEDERVTEWNDVELFIPLENNNNISTVEECDCICMMTFQGAIQCRSYLHSKATVGEAIRALKIDIVRSIITRCAIHCENLLLIEEEQEDPIITHDIPKRVFAPLPQDPICVCDYPSHTDATDDSVEAFKELLDLDLTQNDIDTSCEQALDASMLNFCAESPENRSSESENTSAHSSRIYLAGAFITAVLAAVSYMMIPMRD